jgi:hypothetical protein
MRPFKSDQRNAIVCGDSDFIVKIYCLMIISKSVRCSRVNRNGVLNLQKQCTLTLEKVKRSLAVRSEMGLNKGIVNSDVKPFNCARNGITMAFYESRKENLLNSLFNKRRSRLVKITKENRKIYQRINSQ